MLIYLALGSRDIDSRGVYILLCLVMLSLKLSLLSLQRKNELYMGIPLCVIASSYILCLTNPGWTSCLYIVK